MLIIADIELERFQEEMLYSLVQKINWFVKTRTTDT